MSKVIAVTSGKGGTGKSSICSGLGYTLAKQGSRTLIIELDFGLRCIDIIFGMQGKIKYDLGDVLHNRVKPLDAVTQVPMASNLNSLRTEGHLCKRNGGANRGYLQADPKIF